MSKLLDDVTPLEWDLVAHKVRGDTVNSPAHYTYGTIESIQAIEASMEPSCFKGFLKGNVLKYLWRYERKNGIEDLRKAEWYLRRLIETEVGV